MRLSATIPLFAQFALELNQLTFDLLLLVINGCGFQVQMMRINRIALNCRVHEAPLALISDRLASKVGGESFVQVSRGKLAGK